MDNVKVKSARNMIDLCWNMTLLFACGICVLLLPDQAMASGSNAIEVVFCNIVGVLNGTTGKAVATVAIIAVGVGALLGKISWAMALIVALGIALVFGAGSIVNAISGTDQACTSGALGGDN
jgi:type IV secretion system protein VirB2